MASVRNFSLGPIAFRFMLAALALPATAAAQFYDDPGLGERPVTQHPQDYKPLGVRAGSFMLHPGVQLAGEYTDNVFYTEDNTESDTVFHVRPYVTAQSTWSRHSLNLTAAADFAFYTDYSDRDYEDYFLGLTGRVDVRTRSFFSYGLDYLDLHEDLNNRSAEQGVEPTTYYLTGGNVGYDHTFNRLSLGVSYRYEKLDYDDVLRANGEIIDNQDRDRDGSSFGFRAGYQFQTDKQAFVSYTYYTVDYDQPLDRNGYERSGDGYTVDGGLMFTITGKLDGDVFVSYHDRSYDDPHLEQWDGWALGAGLTWLPTDITRVHGNIASSIEETTDSNSSGYLQTVYSLRVDHELTRSLQGNVFVSYREADYENLPAVPVDVRTKDDTWRAGLGVNWFINRHSYLNASYMFETLDSSVANDDYDVNRIWLVFGLEY